MTPNLIGILKTASTFEDQINREINYKSLVGAIAPALLGAAGGGAAGYFIGKGDSEDPETGEPVKGNRLMSSLIGAGIGGLGLGGLSTYINKKGLTKEVNNTLLDPYAATGNSNSIINNALRYLK